MPDLLATDLVVGYGGKPVLRGVTLAARGGESIAIVGPNGAGKTTLLRCIGGVISPRRGSVVVDGMDLRSLRRREIARRIAVVPQVMETMFPFTLREVVSLGRTARLGAFGMPRAADRQAIERALAQVGLLELADSRIDHVSGGERQRAVVAMALAQDSDVLLLDEPTTHLDPSHQRATLSHARDLAVRHGMLVIAVLHDLNLASAFASRVIVLKEGTVVRDAAPAEALDAVTVADVFGAGLRVLREGDRAVVIPDPLT